MLNNVKKLINRNNIKCDLPLLKTFFWKCNKIFSNKIYIIFKVIDKR